MTKNPPVFGTFINHGNVCKFTIFSIFIYILTFYEAGKVAEKRLLFEELEEQLDRERGKSRKLRERVNKLEATMANYRPTSASNDAHEDLEDQLVRIAGHHTSEYGATLDKCNFSTEWNVC